MLSRKHRKWAMGLIAVATAMLMVTSFLPLLYALR